MKSLSPDICALRFSTGTSHEVSEEFSLPDYMPEVRRIVSCSATVLPETKFIDSDEITLSGLVTYTVLYIGDDGRLTSAPLNSEYTARISCGGADMTNLTEEGILEGTVIVSTSHRATGPRRLSLSARLHSKIFSVYGVRSEENIRCTADGNDGGVTAADELTLERKSVTIPSTRVTCHSATGTASGSFRERTGTKVVACFAGGGVTDVRLAADSVGLRGDVYISCLTMDEAGEYSSVRIKSPVEETVSTGVHGTRDTSGCDASAFLRCAGISISEGSEGEFTWSMEYDIDVIRTESRRAEVTDDIYSTKYETETESEALPSLVCLKNGNSRLSISGTKQIAGGESKHVSHVAGKVTVDKADCTADGMLRLNGSCTLYVITVGGGEVAMEEVVLPVKLETTCESCEGERSVICESCVMYADARLDGSKLSVDAELCFSFFVYAACKTLHVGSCVIDRERQVGLRGNCIKIYLPEPEEEMWDIGKRYHCEVRQITPVGTGGTVIIGD